VEVGHPFPDGSFYRHGWHSWRPVRWVGLGEAQSGRGVGAVQGPSGDVLLLGGLGLDARVSGDAYTLAGTGTGTPVEWLLAYGPEAEVFARYAHALGERLGSRARPPGRVWCSWYSFWRRPDEESMARVLAGLDGLGIGTFQVDDGWQRAIGDWHANERFPAGMAALARRIRERGLRAGLWLAPFVARADSELFAEHADWFVPGEAGINWGGPYHGLDLSQERVLDFVRETIARVTGWGYTYLKLDFLFGGALDPGGEAAYRRGLEAVREVAGNAYLLACGAPVLPSLGLVEGLRIGPDVAPYWEIDGDHSDAVLAEPAARHAVSTSLGRLWLAPLVALDPDVVFFRRRECDLTGAQKGYVQDMAAICDFRATSDPPDWLEPGEREALAGYLAAAPEVRRLDRYRFSIDGREVDFSPVVFDDSGARERAR
jgi:alpha-galactosidase